MKQAKLEISRLQSSIDAGLQSNEAPVDPVRNQNHHNTFQHSDSGAEMSNSMGNGMSCKEHAVLIKRLDYEVDEYKKSLKVCIHMKFLYL